MSRGEVTHQRSPAQAPHADSALCATFSQEEGTSLRSASGWPPSALRAPSPAGGGRQSGDAAVKPLSRLRERGWGEGTAAGSRPRKPSCERRGRHTSAVTRSNPATLIRRCAPPSPREKERAPTPPTPISCTAQ
ncbi:hypothetical protein BI315_14200 [Xanthomonas citri pv. citri]|uniref:Uncharacterized protein n=1 Tax=Xanthomonas axonopodis pv. citri (strain 306) TaxID=190486 RepID=A0AAI7ZCD9_XANAC|nr:hypothetical protein XAC0167 [Xanthomonas citri pv. citri str. 306]AGI06380.1 Hypothetical protein XCAW_00561 [Xanthomonas citri subsp. citri Aw12879]APR08949.1 hypothetical protein BI314_00700 [Xanthomonas citri pv. citri]QYF42942.1 hypothetical protein HZS93_00184 [Xanthomonas citri]APR15806.1 hypothetical protein BI315_14200 [Xanthomonas citri pv. citri]